MSFLFKKVAETDAAEFRIVHAKGVGKWWVEPNVSMFGGEWGNGRKEFATREEAEKYAKGTGKTYIVRDECEGEDAAMDARGDGDIRMTLHAAENQIAGVMNVLINRAVNKTAKEIIAIDELKGVIGIIHKIASVF